MCVHVCIALQLGTKYAIRKATFGEYVDDLVADNQRSRNSYLAVQNLRKALPQLQV